MRGWACGRRVNPCYVIPVTAAASMCTPACRQSSLGYQAILSYVCDLDLYRFLGVRT